jgi:hypothetical protein
MVRKSRTTCDELVVQRASKVPVADGRGGINSVNRHAAPVGNTATQIIGVRLAVA